MTEQEKEQIKRYWHYTLNGVNYPFSYLWIRFMPDGTIFYGESWSNKVIANFLTQGTLKSLLSFLLKNSQYDFEIIYY